MGKPVNKLRIKAPLFEVESEGLIPVIGALGILLILVLYFIL